MQFSCTELLSTEHSHEIHFYVEYNSPESLLYVQFFISLYISYVGAVHHVTFAHHRTYYRMFLYFNLTHGGGTWRAFFDVILVKSWRTAGLKEITQLTRALSISTQLQGSKDGCMQMKC